MYLVLFKTKDPRCPDGGYVVKCLTAKQALDYVEDLEEDAETAGVYDIEIWQANKMD